MATFVSSLFLLVLFALLFVVGIGLYLLSRVFGGFGNMHKAYRTFKGSGSDRTSETTDKKSSNAYGSTTTNQETYSSPGKQDKVFGQSEGTYVDFEELND